jgi:hypothetical protein
VVDHHICGRPARIRHGNGETRIRKTRNIGQLGQPEILPCVRLASDLCSSEHDDGDDEERKFLDEHDEGFRFVKTAGKSIIC